MCRMVGVYCVFRIAQRTLRNTEYAIRNVLTLAAGIFHSPNRPTDLTETTVPATAVHVLCNVHKVRHFFRVQLLHNLMTVQLLYIFLCVQVLCNQVIAPTLGGRTVARPRSCTAPTTQFARTTHYAIRPTPRPTSSLSTIHYPLTTEVQPIRKGGIVGSGRIVSDLAFRRHGNPCPCIRESWHSPNCKNHSSDTDFSLTTYIVTTTFKSSRKSKYRLTLSL